MWRLVWPDFEVKNVLKWRIPDRVIVRVIVVLKKRKNLFFFLKTTITPTITPTITRSGILHFKTFLTSESGQTDLQIDVLPGHNYPNNYPNNYPIWSSPFQHIFDFKIWPDKPPNRRILPEHNYPNNYGTTNVEF